MELIMWLAIRRTPRHVTVENHRGPAHYTAWEWLCWYWLCFSYPRERQSWLRYVVLGVLWSTPGVLIGLGLWRLFFALGGR